MVDVQAITEKTSSVERETIKKITWRLMPILMLGFFCNFLDRVNVGMAAPTMNPDLGLTGAMFGFGAGIFFFGYLIAEVPSNLVLNKVGARRWIARILITWGIVSGLTAFVWDQWSFFGIRLLLGLAEAGFFPGVVLYLTWWFPSSYRTRMMAVFYTAVVISLIIGPPISGLLLYMDGILGLHGWQWMFVIEALPPIIMSVVTWKYLTDRPRDAGWLDDEQKSWLEGRLAAERAQRESIRKFSLSEVFTDPKIWILTIAYVGHNIANFGLTFFLPLIVKGLGVPTGLIGVVTGLPFVFALIAMNFMSRRSDRSGERIWYVAGAWLTVAIGLAACTFIGGEHPVLLMMALCVVAMGLWVAPAVFWALPSAMLTGTAAAAGIAMINAVGNLGGWLGPWMFGWAKDASGSATVALLCLAGAALASVLAVLVVGHDRRLESIPDRD